MRGLFITKEDAKKDIISDPTPALPATPNTPQDKCLSLPLQLSVPHKFTSIKSSGLTVFSGHWPVGQKTPAQVFIKSPPRSAVSTVSLVSMQCHKPLSYYHPSSFSTLSTRPSLFLSSVTPQP